MSNGKAVSPLAVSPRSCSASLKLGTYQRLVLLSEVLDLVMCCVVLSTDLLKLEIYSIGLHADLAVLRR